MGKWLRSMRPAVSVMPRTVILEDGSEHLLICRNAAKKS